MKALLSLFIFTALFFTQTLTIQLAISPEDNFCLLEYYGRKPSTRFISEIGCERGLERIGQSCYEACSSGYQAYGQTCIGICPAGYLQCGEFCTQADSCERVESYEGFVIAIHEAAEMNSVKADLSNLLCSIRSAISF